MTAILCRLGNKKNIKNIIIKQIPKDFNLYIEPFVGSGIIFLNLKLKENNKNSILNDLDKIVIEAHNSIKQGVTLDENNFSFSQNGKVQTEFYKKKHNNNNDKFLASIISLCGTFMGDGVGKIYKSKIITNKNFINKIKHAKKQKEYYSNTRLFNTDYINIIKKFDNKNSFFYLDPPYENSVGIYNNNTIDLEFLSELLSNLKGRFLLSLNDSPNIRKIFKKFKIISINVPISNTHNKKDILNRQELIIKNY